MNDAVSVPEAASILGLSPGRVRALVGQGQLPGSKIGGRWVVERAGRLRPANAVGASAADRSRAPTPGRCSSWLPARASRESTPSVRSRLRRALRLERFGEAWAAALPTGRDPFLRCPPGGDRLHPRGSGAGRDGVSAAAEHGLDLVSGQEADGYLRAARSKKFAASHALSPAGPLATCASGSCRTKTGDSWRNASCPACRSGARPDPRTGPAPGPGRPTTLRDLDR